MSGGPGEPSGAPPYSLPPDHDARRRTLESGVANGDCDAEPIHIPGGIQPHGYLLAVSDALIILQASENLAALTGAPVEALLGQPLETLLGESTARRLAHAATNEALDQAPLYLGVVANPSFDAKPEDNPPDADAEFDITLHRHDGVLIVEIEVARHEGADVFASMYPLVRTFARSLQDVASVGALAQLAVREVRAITQFGRVMLYRFDEEGRSEVLAEAREPEYASFLHQFFPASDIPRQARALYLRNRVRLVADVNYRPARIVPAVNPVTGRPLDLSFATLRSFSPVHLEYMRNMGTHASMSVSLVVRGKLWGLISCHDHAPRLVPFERRMAIEHLGNLLSLQIEAKEERAEAAYLLNLRRVTARLIGAMAERDDFVDALRAAPNDVLMFSQSTGAAVVLEDKVTLIGTTPDADTVLALTQWLAASTSGIYATDVLPKHWPRAAQHADTACGVLAVPVSQIFRHYVLWFRPEVMRTIKWAGEPIKLRTAEGGNAPRTDFAPWLETVRNHAPRWLPGEIEVAGEFRAATLNIVLRRAEELAQLATELARANKELEAFSYSVSHDLRAPLRHIAGYGDLLREQEAGNLSERSLRFLNNMLDSARFAGTLVDDLLTFSQMGRAALRPGRVDLNELVRSIVQEFGPETAGRDVQWSVGELPVVTADATFLQLALRNLIANAVKYTNTRESAKIEVFAEDPQNAAAEEFVIGVRDNGVGFDMKYVGKLFGVFQRLHRAEEFDGTGIGLANVRRIVERHDGRTWAEGRVDEGATFYFSLPKTFRPEPALRLGASVKSGSPLGSPPSGALPGVPPDTSRQGAVNTATSKPDHA